MRQRDDLEQVRQELYQEEQAEIIKLKAKVSQGKEESKGQEDSIVKNPAALWVNIINAAS